MSFPLQFWPSDGCLMTLAVISHLSCSYFIIFMTIMFTTRYVHETFMPPSYHVITRRGPGVGSGMEGGRWRDRGAEGSLTAVAFSSLLL